MLMWSYSGGILHYWSCDGFVSLEQYLLVIDLLDQRKDIEYWYSFECFGCSVLIWHICASTVSAVGLQIESSVILCRITYTSFYWIEYEVVLTWSMYGCCVCMVVCVLLLYTCCCVLRELWCRLHLGYKLYVFVRSKFVSSVCWRVWVNGRLPVGHKFWIGV